MLSFTYGETIQIESRTKSPGGVASIQRVRSLFTYSTPQRHYCTCNTHTVSVYAGIHHYNVDVLVPAPAHHDTYCQRFIKLIGQLIVFVCASGLQLILCHRIWYLLLD